MSLAVLTINDAGLQLAVNGDLIRTSPGYAVLNGDQLMIGEEAASHAKLLPRWTNNRYWMRLDTNPIQSGNAQVRHHADLAFAHLESLWQPIKDSVDRVMIVVPAHFAEEQLGLLLGLGNACEMPVKGLVDYSIVAAADLPLAETILHLDIHLHCITLTKISNSGSLIRKESRTIVETGLFALRDRWANAIASQFIASTRFDPMHNAASEQQLYDQLPNWIKTLDKGNTTHPFELELDGSIHSVSVSAETLLKSCATVFPKIVQAIRAETENASRVSLLVSHHFDGVPGLTDSLGLLSNLEIHQLAETKCTGSATLHEVEILGDKGAINHVVQLSAGDLVPSEQVPGPARPSHLLWNHRAYPIGKTFGLSADASDGPKKSKDPLATLYVRGDHLLIDCDGDTADDRVMNLNGNKPENGMTLSIGDTLDVGGESFTFISVASSG
ncbi:MAG: hypothetical protein ACI8Z1_000505 [Candidatus Azotimanducaceae bacterium]